MSTDLGWFSCGLDVLTVSLVFAESSCNVFSPVVGCCTVSLLTVGCGGAIAFPTSKLVSCSLLFVTSLPLLRFCKRFKFSCVASELITNSPGVNITGTFTDSAENAESVGLRTRDVSGLD